MADGVNSEVHLRCQRSDVAGLRVDLMTKMRGVDSFPVLWDRRTTLAVEGGPEISSLALPDLVASKKTRRDKDWPMLRRLVEANYVQFANEPTNPRVDFWLRELRTPELRAECVERFSKAAEAVRPEREAVAAAIAGDLAATGSAIDAKQARERATDEAYWKPLLRELEVLRHRMARRRRGRR